MVRSLVIERICSAILRVETIGQVANGLGASMAIRERFENTPVHVDLNAYPVGNSGTSVLSVLV